MVLSKFQYSNFLEFLGVKFESNLSTLNELLLSTVFGVPHILLPYHRQDNSLGPQDASIYAKSFFKLSVSNFWNRMDPTKLTFGFKPKLEFIFTYQWIYNDTLLKNVHTIILWRMRPILSAVYSLFRHEIVYQRSLGVIRGHWATILVYSWLDWKWNSGLPSCFCWLPWLLRRTN